MRVCVSPCMHARFEDDSQIVSVVPDKIGIRTLKIT